ncbi:HYC_CC_PP family protein [Tenacibaculum aestuariivivum]|uniref:HYC_CC_PP family protein n=1 Tax=Tenacibaculum aestuariivivum TaxID=2006131 RepID=UPI003AB1B1EA
MKQLFTKITTLLLALLVMFSTFSFTVVKHYCGDFLVAVSYVGKADTCGTSVVKDTCETVHKKKKCCKDELSQIEGQDNIQKVSLQKISFDSAKLFIAFNTFYTLFFQEIEQEKAVYKQYFPPDFKVNFQILHQVFII